MLLWIVFAVLTAAVIGALSHALLRSNAVEPADKEASLAVYRDQLGEVDRDLARGLSTPEEAAAVRTELARRMLRAAEEAPHEEVAAVRSAARGRFVAVAISVMVPLAGLAVYLASGSPDLPGQPYAERLAGNKSAKSVDELVGLVEARLAAKPDDGEGWSVIAPVYLRQGRYADAMRAYANALRVLGESESRLAGFAEAAVLANDGIVVPPARKAYARLAELAPDRPEPQFWLALAKEQDGDTKGALAELEHMLANAPPDAPWRGVVEERISALRNPGKPAPQQPAAPTSGDAATAAATPPPGPSASDVAAAAQMTQDERAKMIETMVGRLAERLEGNGKDLEGWQRLARAYKVLGRDADARAAIAKARTNFNGDAQATQTLDALAKELGLGS